MEELVGLRIRLLAKAYDLCYDKTPFPDWMGGCIDKDGSLIFESACFDEEAYEAVKDSSIYHIIYEFDGEIDYLGFNKNFLTQWKYGYISEEEYKEITED
jgi:hypothetical protein